MTPSQHICRSSAPHRRVIVDRLENFRSWIESTVIPSQHVRKWKCDVK